jgi:YfiH family protein
MNREITLHYGKVVFGTIGKEDGINRFFGDNPELKKTDNDLKSPEDWFRYTTETFYLKYPEVDGTIHCLHQVHGDTIHPIESDTLSQGKEEQKEGDGLYTFQKKQILVVRTADCVPVFIYSVKRPFVAVIHSGWKGTKLGIAEKMIELILKEGFQLDELQIELGPYIQKDHYEVGEDVAQFFVGLGEDVCEPKGKGKYHLDVGQAIENRIKRRFGEMMLVKNSKIEVFQSPQFFSHRAKEEGRNLNFILWES